MDALYSYKDAFNLSVDYTLILDQYLNKFKRDPKSNPYGYKILHGDKIPFDKAPGDGIGLFPINYLTRAVANPSSNETETDWKIVNKVTQDFILKWPYRLPDDTFSRHSGWKGETDRNASFLWVDDQFVGLTLISRLAAVTKDPKLANFAATQLVGFAQHMMDKDDFLFFHGYNDADKKVSCCKWGRGNGWAMMAYVEVRLLISTANSPAVQF